MTAGETGVQLTVFSGGFDMTNYGASLSVKGPSDQQTGARVLPLAVQQGGTEATLRSQEGTLATDFPVPGRYEIQLVVQNGATLFRSPIATLQVGDVVA